MACHVALLILVLGARELRQNVRRELASLGRPQAVLVGVGDHWSRLIGRVPLLVTLEGRDLNGRLMYFQERRFGGSGKTLDNGAGVRVHWQKSNNINAPLPLGSRKEWGLGGKSEM